MHTTRAKLIKKKKKHGLIKTFLTYLQLLSLMFTLNDLPLGLMWTIHSPVSYSDTITPRGSWAHWLIIWRTHSPNLLMSGLQGTCHWTPLTCRKGDITDKTTHTHIFFYTQSLCMYIHIKKLKSNYGIFGFQAMKQAIWKHPLTLQGTEQHLSVFSDMSETKQ